MAATRLVALLAFLFVVTLAASAALTAPDPALAGIVVDPVIWTRAYAPTDGHDEWSCSATGRDGSLYVAGTRNVDTANADVIVARYESGGDRRWARRLDLPRSQAGVAIAVDRWGSAYVLATTDSDVTGGNVLLVKYSSGGRLLWKARYTSSGDNPDRGNALRVDLYGNAYVAGYSQRAVTYFDMFLMKYRSDGTRAWKYFWNGGSDSMDWAMGLALDSQRRCYVSGFSRGGGENVGVVLRVGSDGELDWQDIPPLPNNGIAECRDIAVRGDTVAVTALVSSMATGHDVWTLSYTPGGVRRWAEPWDYDDFDYPGDLAVDADGAIVVCGTADNEGGGTAPDHRGYVFKRSAAGGLLWDELYWNEPIDGDGWFRDLVLRSDGVIYCLGAIRAPTGDTDALLVKYTSAGLRLRAAAIDKSGAHEADSFECAALRRLSSGTTLVYGAGFYRTAGGNTNALAARLTP